MMVRAIYRAICIQGGTAPYDRANLKVYYPGDYGDSAEERNSGVIPAHTSGAPFPVLIILPGINVGPEAYSWLAHTLVERGLVCVTFSHVAEEMPGYISLTPGLSIAALAPDNYGHRPSATVLGSILEELQLLNTTGVLEGKLNLDRIVLGGHSAGGSVALLNARADWFPGVCAAFSYGAHAGAATALGWPEDALFELPDALPVLIMGGTQDGCIANSGARYGKSQTSAAKERAAATESTAAAESAAATEGAAATEKVERTFDEALRSDRGDSYLAIIDGANHFSMAWPADHSTGRPFIDLPATQPDEQLRELLGQLVCQFCRYTTTADEESRLALDNFVEHGHPLVTRVDRR